MRSRLLALAMLSVFVVAACGGSGGGEATSGQDVVVRMFDNRYEFEEITVPVGGTVNFRGTGRNPHNAVAVDGSWSTEDAFGTLWQIEGDDAVIHFEQPGVYPFFCTFHGNDEGIGMVGTIIVEEDA